MTSPVNHCEPSKHKRSIFVSENVLCKLASALSVAPENCLFFNPILTGGGQYHPPKVYNVNKTMNIQARIMEMVCKFLKLS